MPATDTPTVAVVGAGPAGLTAGIFTARAGLETTVLNAGEPILARNALVENFPGFPAGVDSRLLLDLWREQADRNGVDRRETDVRRVQPGDDRRLSVALEDGESLAADYVVCASWADTDYLAEFEDLGLTKRGSKTYVDVEDDGSTGVEGLYAAGRVAGTHHQAVVAAGDGASVALHVIEDSEVPFYHDWVAPEGYFTGRGREVPPGCEEIDADERRRREAESMALMRERFAERHPEEPTPHPSLAED